MTEIDVLEDYIKNGYKIVQFDCEEDRYSDNDVRQSGDRVVIHMMLERRDKSFFPNKERD